MVKIFENLDLEQILRSEGGGQSLMKMISNEVAAVALGTNFAYYF